MRVRQVGAKKKVDYQYISPDGKKFASVASAVSSTKVEAKREGEVSGKESANMEGNVGRGIALARKRVHTWRKESAHMEGNVGRGIGLARKRVHTWRKESANMEGNVGRGIAREAQKRKCSSSLADRFVIFRNCMLQEMRCKHGGLPQDHQSTISQAWQRKKQSFTGVTAEPCRAERQRGGASAGKGRRQQGGGTTADIISGVGPARKFQTAIRAIVNVRFQVVMF